MDSTAGARAQPLPSADTRQEPSCASPPIRLSFRSDLIRVGPLLKMPEVAMRQKRAQRGRGNAAKCAAALLLLIFFTAFIKHPVVSAKPGKVFSKNNLVAWCIVPFDSKRRGPEERAQMLSRLGFTKFAYDYRAEHIPTFDAEIDAFVKI